MSIFFDDLDTFFAGRGLKRRGKTCVVSGCERDAVDDLCALHGGEPIRFLGEWLEDSFDYGVQWRDEQGRQYRLTWIGTAHRHPGDGGELYLVRLTNGFVARSEDVTVVFGGDDGGLVEFLCVIPPSEPRGVTDATDGNVEDILVGWADACGPPGSINWIRDRVRSAIAEGKAVAP